jgi:hypothetical protein
VRPFCNAVSNLYADYEAAWWLNYLRYELPNADPGMRQTAAEELHRNGEKLTEGVQRLSQDRRETIKRWNQLQADYVRFSATNKFPMPPTAADVFRASVSVRTVIEGELHAIIDGMGWDLPMERCWD